MDNNRMIEMVLAMFRKEKSIWTLWGKEGADRLAEVDAAEMAFHRMVADD